MCSYKRWECIEGMIGTIGWMGLDGVLRRREELAAEEEGVPIAAI